MKKGNTLEKVCFRKIYAILEELDCDCEPANEIDDLARRTCPRCLLESTVMMLERCIDE